MSYKNFIPEVWSEAINRDLTRLEVFAADCNRQYEGEVKQKGDSVRILGVGRPTITTVGRDGFSGLTAPEQVEDTAVVMQIDQMSYFNYSIDDIDKRQAVGDVMDILNTEASEGLADVQDKFIADLAKDKLAVNFATSAFQVTKDNILEYLLKAHQKLRENDVRYNTKVTVTLPPSWSTIFKQAYIYNDTDNSELMRNGAIAKFDGMYIKESNNVASKTESGHSVDLVQVKTDKAIAFARPMVHTEAYRPENGFSDAVKGFALYGGKIVRPKEMIILNGYI